MTAADAAKLTTALRKVGYHRICAVHLVDEDAEIPCRIVDLD